MPRIYAPAKYTHAISFKVDDEMILIYDALRSTFPGNSWAEVGRWIASDSEILEIFRKRITEGAPS